MRDHSAAAPPVARIVARALRSRAVLEPHAAVLAGSRPRGGLRGPRSARARRRWPRSARRIRRPVALPPAWMIRRRLWPPSRPSARSPRRSASNFTPSSTRSLTRAGASSVRTSAAARRVRPRPAISVSSRCERGRVVERERGGGAALRPVGGGLGERARGDERDVGALAGGGQRGEQPGRAGADDDEVGSHTPTRYYGVRDGGELTPRDLAAPRRRLRPRRARTPRAAGADPGPGGRDERARVVRRSRGSQAPEVERSVLGAGAPGGVRGLDPSAVRGGRRRDRRGHVRGARDVRGRVCGPRAARWRWSTRCWAARRPWV